MSANLDLRALILVVQQHHPDFSYQEIEELCLEYLAQFNSKTKEATKEKSLKKYLAKTFALEREEDEKI